VPSPTGPAGRLGATLIARHSGRGVAFYATRREFFLKVFDVSHPLREVFDKMNDVTILNALSAGATSVAH